MSGFGQAKSSDMKMAAYVDEANEIHALLAIARNVLAITHVSPDGDAIGSLTAVAVALKQLGHIVSLACDDGSPARFEYLPLVSRIRQAPPPDVAYDLVIAVDCGDMSRMGKAFAMLPEPHPPIINIDHHVTNTLFGEVNLVDSNCVSTTEILYRLFLALDIQITADLATCLLTGIVTDTLGFRTVGVSSNTFQVAGSLMDAGADLDLITAQALLIKPLGTLRLWQIGLDNMKLECDGVLWTSITNEQRKSIGYLGTSSGGLVNMMANVDEAAMSAVLLEDDQHVYVGFRCRPPYNVAELAVNLGGGGHPLAAGCTLARPLREAESLVVGMACDAIRQQRELLNSPG